MGSRALSLKAYRREEANGLTGLQFIACRRYRWSERRRGGPVARHHSGRWRDRGVLRSDGRDDDAVGRVDLAGREPRRRRFVYRGFEHRRGNQSVARAIRCGGPGLSMSSPGRTAPASTAAQAFAPPGSPLPPRTVPGAAGPEPLIGGGGTLLDQAPVHRGRMTRIAFNRNRNRPGGQWRRPVTASEDASAEPGLFTASRAFSTATGRAAGISAEAAIRCSRLRSAAARALSGHLGSLAIGTTRRKSPNRAYDRRRGQVRAPTQAHLFEVDLRRRRWRESAPRSGRRAVERTPRRADGIPSATTCASRSSIGRSPMRGPRCSRSRRLSRSRPGGRTGTF